MPEESAVDGGTVESPPVAGDGTSQASVAPSADAGVDERARKQAAERRIQLRDERAKTESLEAELATMKAREAKILSAAGVSADDTVSTDDAVKAAEQQTAAVKAQASKALLKAKFTAAAAQVMDPSSIEDAFILADAKGQLADVLVDLDTSTVEGMTDAVDRIVQDMPSFAKKPAAGVDNHHAGGPKGSHIDLQNVKPGDMTRLKAEHPEEYAAMLERGIKIPLSTFGTDADGNYARETVTMKTGQDAAIARIDQIVANANKRG